MRLGLNVNELVDYKFDYFICQSGKLCADGPAGLIEKRRQTVKRVSLDSPALYYMARDCETFGYYFYDSNIYLEGVEGEERGERDTMPNKPKVITFL